MRVIFLDHLDAGSAVLGDLVDVGHSSISITQRYVHPQSDAIDRVFAEAEQLRLGVGTIVGTVKWGEPLG